MDFQSTKQTAGLHNNLIKACRHCGGSETHPTADGKSKKFSGCLKDIVHGRSPNREIATIFSNEKISQ
ncbi:MAG: hypothetical protein IJ143_01780 [Neisseriaceae bacterium]|nr:hypothetical protein [Neisseriaceae bacterium]